MTKIYHSPTIRIVKLSSYVVLAASALGRGMVDGQGLGQFEAPAKQSSWLFDDSWEVEEE